MGASSLSLIASVGGGGWSSALRDCSLGTLTQAAPEAERGVNSNVVPNDVQQDIFEPGIAVVAVGAPAAGAQVNFHVAGTRRGVADLNDRAAKIRPAFDADKTGMQNPDGSAIGGLEPVALQPLVAPDGLEQAFRRRIIFVAQGIRQAEA